MTNTQRFRIDRHGMGSVLQMCVTRDELVAAVVAPEIVYPSHGDEIRVRGDLEIVFMPEIRTVKTVKWRGRESRVDLPEGRRLAW